MKRVTFSLRRSAVGIMAAAIFLTAIAVDRAEAALSTQVEANFQSYPVLNVASATPLVMLNLSRDTSLFSRAYNDYSALITGSPAIQTTYSDQVEYYGYFDSEKCYNYSSDTFVPSGAVSGYVSTSTLPSNHYCSGQWSGNFLNWATMSRIDDVRKLLYGGLRVEPETTTSTVLERAYFPPDGHAWAKYYNGTDIASLTPIATATNVTATGSGKTNASPAASSCWGGGGNCSTLTVTNVTGLTTATALVSDQICLTPTGSACVLNGQGPPVNVAGGALASTYIIGRIKSFSGSTITMEIPLISGVSSYAGLPNCSGTCNWTITDFSTPGVTLCNLTQSGYGTSSNSQNIVTTPASGGVPPLVRVSAGDHRLWGANESYQCLWSEQKSNTGNGGFAIAGSNGNLAYFSGLPSSDDNPSQTTGINAGSHYTGDSYNGEYVVRVQACVSSALIVNENCETYSSGDIKPIGLLQTYGETGQIKFGLITGSYNKNISGGVVRSNLPLPSVNGTNSLTSEISPTTGVFLSPTGAGIIATLNNLKIYGYNYESGGGADNYGDGDGCPYQQSAIVHGSGSGEASEGNCSNWGNAISEAYLEAVRYFAGAGLTGGDSPTPKYAYTSSGSRDATLGLAEPAWTDPLNNNNYCASLNVLTFNGAVPTYEDTNSGNAGYYDSFNNLTLTQAPAGSISGTSVAAWTDLVGAGTGTGDQINGGNWFIGSTVGENVNDPGYQKCTAKTISTLSTASGVCPDGPALSGSYMLAGIAYAAHINRIRADLTSVPPVTPAGPGGIFDTTSLKVNMYGIQLASNTPVIKIPVPGSTTQIVTITPTYNATWGSGRLIDFRIVLPNAAASCPTLVAGTTCGSYYINFEDSQQGGDYDQDLWGIISYSITASTITVTTASIGASSGSPQGFGFTINGTTQDGPHFFAGAYGYGFTDPGVSATCTLTSAPDNGTCNTPAAPRSFTFTLNPATVVQSLQDPLFYAAKWGGFVDDPPAALGGSGPFADGLPDAARKYDQFNNATGAPGSDAIPDNYYLVSNPTQLQASLNRAFSQIIAKVASGTAASVVANAASGSGAVYQAFYEPAHEEPVSPNRTVNWLGTLQALFIGPDGNLYEDNNQDGALEIGTDHQILFTFDPTTNSTKFTDVTAGTTNNPLSSLIPIWNARQTLAKPATGAVVAQRTFTTSDETKRYIFTWINHSGNGTVIPTDIEPFTTDATGIQPADYFYLNLVSPSSAPAAAATEATNIINWVRGEDIAGYRNRTLTYNVTDATPTTQRLGDIIDSTPAVVSTPRQAFDLLYGDVTYGAYRNAYACRRQVVMVGANDGMLHAFNAGFYNVANEAFATAPNNGTCATGPTSTNGWALGEEIWAYVPQNLLPQLRWMTGVPTTTPYTHVFYVDGSPRIFDVNLPNAITHTCSAVVNSVAIDCSHWGTIAVVPFRLGGGLIQDNINGNGTTLRSYHSGYIVMDVTDPEVPPTLLGEITLPANQLATSSPTIATIRTPDVGSGTTKNSWFLVVGSGPDQRTTVSSDQTGNVYVYDLNNLGGYDATGATVPLNTFALTGTGATNSFVGDIVAADWNLDFQSEGLYFGNQQTAAAPDFNGTMYKLQTHTAGTAMPDATLATWGMYTLYALPAKQPVTARPVLGLDNNATPYVFAGTGRLWTTSDQGTTAQQAIYGLKDYSETLAHPTSNCTTPSACVTDLTANLLVDNGVTVDTNGNVAGGPATTFANLVADATNNCVGSPLPSPCYDGWVYSALALGNTATQTGSERVLNSQDLLGGELFTTTYIPNTSLCGGNGTSNLFAQNYQTGTATPSSSPPFGTGTGGSVNLSMSLGAGAGSSPSLVLTPSAGGGSGMAPALESCVQTSTGAIVCTPLGTIPGAANGEVSWRTLRNNN